MGDRASISFRKDDEESVTLFSHWGGQGFFKTAQEYANELRQERKGRMMPLDRMEPNTVMVDFIRFLTRDEKRVESNLYLGVDKNDGDNSDNGHRVIEL